MNKRIDEVFERMVWAIGRQSERVVFGLAAALYIGIGLALPVALGWSIPWLVGANMIGTTWAGVVILAWVATGVQARYRRQLVEWTSDLRRLDSTEFEWLVGEIFRREGWTVTETGRPDGPDGNIDLKLKRDRRTVIVQCKRWASWQVGVDEVRALAGTATREALAPTDAFFVTLSDFTGPARSEAEKLGLLLVDGADLYRRMERVRTPQPCAICSQPMRLDRSHHGWWYRCTKPGCMGKRDLGRDPGRVVGLLVQQPD